MFSMKYVRLAGIVCLVLLMLFPSMAEARKRVKKKAGPYRVSANAALLFDESGWHKYYARNVEKRVLPASTTKVMTALLVMERLNLNALVTVSDRATKALPSKIDIKAGEKYRVRDLLFAALLNSANDEAVSGSEVNFVALMNKRARQLGAKNTLFANAHGLPSENPQYTTAQDMFFIFRAALKKEFFRKAIRIRTMTIESVGGRKIFLKSHNKAFSQKWKQGVYGKTGYTNAAKACFVGVVYKGKQALIVAVFGCPGMTRWNDLKHIIERYGKIDL